MRYGESPRSTQRRGRAAALHSSSIASMRSRGTGSPVALRNARMAASSLGEARPDVFLGLALRRFLVFLLVAVRE